MVSTSAGDDASQYDVIIVGGRPAGASLAARLGAAGLRVLILDRATFPSLPAVSAPFLLPHALELLDEIGADEAVYAAATPKLRAFVLEIGDYFRSVFPFDVEISGRDYFYTIDRARLDDALWRNLERFPTVTAWEGAKVLDLVRDGDRVAGVVVERDGETIERRGAAVIGADGRFSLVARRVDAAVTEERADVVTTVYYDFWEGVADYDASGQKLAQIYSSCDGFSAVAMPTADAKTIVLVQGRADYFAALTGDAETNYEAILRARPRIWRRLAGATRRGKVAGMKRVGNLFRAAAGAGWALVGDAYHQKDSIDAQGIYDALIGAKLLARHLIRWRRGEVGWDAAVASYSDEVYAVCKPMFEATMGRLEREVYSVPPPAVAKTMMRWMITHPDYGRRYAEFVTRRLDPATFLTPPLILKFAAKGAVQRLRRRLAGDDPTDPLPLG
ncbi:MAG: NAD(P)/FAD-dependent oxidoreductase [Nannocystaceae bacterium]